MFFKNDRGYEKSEGSRPKVFYNPLFEICFVIEEKAKILN
jgi:hypothetical protein